MEMDSTKQSYLQYYQTNSHSNTFTRQRKRQPPKILPHIAEEYNFRITNHLLVKKIMDPKRDKIIKNSLEKAKKFVSSSSSKKRETNSLKKRHACSSVNFRSGSIKRRNREGEHPKQTMSLSQLQQRQSKKELFMHHTDNFGQEDIQNMSNCESKLFHTLPTSKNATFHFNRTHISEEGKENVKNRSFHGRMLGNVGWYGSGPTILLISHLEIISNPTYKRDTLIQLQLVQRIGMAKDLISNEESLGQKVIKSSPVMYANLPDQNGANIIKFAIRISNIGDFVPLRIWKYIGVDFIEIGTVDLPLSLYKIKTNLLQSQYHNLSWQFVGEGSEMGRKVLKGQVRCQLRKGKKIESNTKVIIKYVIYSKKLTRFKEPAKVNIQ